MPYRLVWESQGVIKKFFGHVTSDELFQAGIDTEADPRFDDYRYVINDFVECTGFSVSPEVVDEIAAIDEAAAKINHSIRIAVVASLPEIIDAANQYASSPMNAYPTRIFTTRQEARIWLGLSAKLETA